MLRIRYALVLIICMFDIGAYSTTVQSFAQPSKERMDAAEAYSVKMGGQTFLVIHDGKIIRESYANGGAPDKIQLLASATKGLVGMAGAIAADEGIIELDKPVVEVLTEWKNDPQKSLVTYRHLLTMSSGFEELKDQTAWTDFLNAKVLFPAGSTFIYGPDPNIFGLAFQRKLGNEKVEDYINRKLFQPLGMRVEWRGRFADGNPQLSGGAYVRANEWYKYGEFVRKMLDGTWNGPKIISKNFFDQVLASSAPYPAYGFYWWLKRPVSNTVGETVDKNNNNQFSTQIKPILIDSIIPNDFVMCRGAYGQCLYVIPSRKLVVVRNAPPNSKQQFQDDVFLDSLLIGGSSPSDTNIVIISNPILKGSENQKYMYQVVARSTVPSSIKYSLEEAPQEMNIDSVTGLITWENPKIGTYQVKVYVSMLLGNQTYSTTQNYTLTIEPKQIPLTITFKSSPPLVGMEGKPYTYAVKAVSSDTTKQVILRLGMNAPSGMTLNAGTNILSWPSPIRGSYPIAIIARIQGDSVIERQSFTLQIQADTTTSVNEDLQLQSSIVFPNPAEHTLRISVPQPMFSFTIMNIIGQHIMSGHSTGSIDISNIQPGMYILLVDNDKPLIELFVKR